MSAPAIAPSKAAQIPAAAPRAEPPAGDLFSVLVGVVEVETQPPALAPKVKPRLVETASADGEDKAEAPANDDKPAADAPAAPVIVPAAPSPLPAPTVGEPETSGAELAAAAAQAFALTPANDESLTAEAPPLAEPISPALDKPPAVEAAAVPMKPDTPEPPVSESAPQAPSAQAAAATAVGQGLPAETAAVAVAQSTAQGAKPATASPVTRLSGRTVVDPSTAATTDVRADGAATTVSPDAIASAEGSEGVGLDASPESDGGAVQAEAEPVPADLDAPSAQQAGFQAALGRDQAAPAVATSGTVSNLAAQIIKRMEGKASRFDIELDPDGLGRVAVQLKIDAQGRLSATLAFDRPESAEALKARAGELRQALEQSGFDLSGSSLSFESAAGGQFAGAFDRDNSDAEERGRSRAFNAGADTAQLAEQTSATRNSRARGLDIRI